MVWYTIVYDVCAACMVSLLFYVAKIWHHIYINLNKKQTVRLKFLLRLLFRVCSLPNCV